jgi:hypothetical protein
MVPMVLVSIRLVPGTEFEVSGKEILKVSSKMFPFSVRYSVSTRNDREEQSYRWMIPAHANRTIRNNAPNQQRSQRIDTDHVLS